MSLCEQGIKVSITANGHLGKAQLSCLKAGIWVSKPSKPCLLWQRYLISIFYPMPISDDGPGIMIFHAPSQLPGVQGCIFFQFVLLQFPKTLMQSLWDKIFRDGGKEEKVCLRSFRGGYLLERKTYISIMWKANQRRICSYKNFGSLSHAQEIFSKPVCLHCIDHNKCKFVEYSMFILTGIPISQSWFVIRPHVSLSSSNKHLKSKGSLKKGIWQQVWLLTDAEICLHSTWNHRPSPCSDWLTFIAGH